MRSVLLALVWISAGLIATAQTTSTTTVQINRHCASARNFAQQHQRDALLFSAIPQNENPARDHWQRLNSRHEFDTAVKNANSTASVWIRDAKVVFVDVLFQNQFGDSTQSVEYCFRPDGTLAELHSDLKSFHGGLRVVREITFDDAGTQIAKTTQSSDLESGEPKKIPPDFWDFPPPIFLRVSDLPFAKDLSLWFAFPSARLNS